MSKTIVCGFNEPVIDQFESRRFVIQTKDLLSINAINAAVNQQNQLVCVQVQTEDRLASIDLDEQWFGIPVCLFMPGLGDFKRVLSKLPLLRHLNVTCFFPSHSKKNYTDLQILSSLGIECGVYFTDTVHWENMTDLMHYTIYGKAEHAPVQPFFYIAANYRPDHITDFSSVYFDNPLEFVQMGSHGNLAALPGRLTTADPAKEGGHSLPAVEKDDRDSDLNGTGSGIKEALCPHTPGENPEAVRDRYMKDLDDHFLLNDGCAWCRAWRVCLGRFKDQAGYPQDCSRFFTEMMAAAAHFQKSVRTGDNQCRQ